MSRTRNAIINVVASFAGQFLGIIVGFMARMIFVRILGEAYLGINGLFTNVLAILSLVELGVGPAMVFSLYRPLARGDQETLKSLMQLYRRAYLVIGCTVALLGVGLAPFLQHLMNQVPDVDHIRLIFLLFVANSAISYFFSYKRSLIIADQHRYIDTFYRYACYLGVNLAQLIFLVVTRNFIVFLLLQVAGTVVENLLVSRKADQMYPFLREGDAVPLDRETKVEIRKNILAMVCHKIGGVVVLATDNILISWLIGVVQVGLYSNYQMVLTALNTLTGQVGNAIVASVGHLGATEDRTRLLTTFHRVNFLYSWIFGFCAVCLFCLLQPFIRLCFGERLLLPCSVMGILVLNFYLGGMRRSVLLFRDALGLYWYDRYKPLVEAAINLAASIFLGKLLGLLGIFLGATISTLFTCFWVEPLVLYRYGFHAPLTDYFRRYAVYTAVTLVALGLTVLLCQLLPGTGLGPFAGKMVICLICPNVVFLLSSLGTQELVYFVALLRHLLKKLFCRKAK